MTATHTRRWMITGLPVVMLALLLGAVMTSPALATDNRQAAVDKSNQFIADCFANGGEPDAETDEDNGSVQVTCDYDDHEDYCFYNYDPPSTNCGTVSHETHADPRWGLSPVTAEPVTNRGDNPPSNDQPGITAPAGDGHHGHGTSHKKGDHRHKQ
jgi:hypothetical protein